MHIEMYRHTFIYIYLHICMSLLCTCISPLWSLQMVIHVCMCVYAMYTYIYTYICRCVHASPSGEICSSLISARMREVRNLKRSRCHQILRPNWRSSLTRSHRSHKMYSKLLHVLDEAFGNRCQLDLQLMLNQGKTKCAVRSMNIEDLQKLPIKLLNRSR